MIGEPVPPSSTKWIANSVVIKKSRVILRALDHPLRQKMLQFIDKRKEAIVTDIYKGMKMEQSETSQHLAILRNAGFVKTRRDGKKIYYSVNYENISLAEKFARSIGELSKVV